MCARDPLTDNEYDWEFDPIWGNRLNGNDPLYGRPSPPTSLEALLRDYPGETAVILEQYGLTTDMLIDDMVDGGLLSAHHAYEAA